MICTEREGSDFFFFSFMVVKHISLLGREKDDSEFWRGWVFFMLTIEYVGLFLRMAEICLKRQS